MLVNLKKPKFKVGDKVYGKQWPKTKENELTVFDINRNLKGEAQYTFNDKDGKGCMFLTERQIESAV